MQVQNSNSSLQEAALSSETQRLLRLLRSQWKAAVRPTSVAPRPESSPGPAPATTAAAILPAIDAAPPAPPHPSQSALLGALLGSTEVSEREQPLVCHGTPAAAAGFLPRVCLPQLARPQQVDPALAPAGRGRELTSSALSGSSLGTDSENGSKAEGMEEAEGSNRDVRGFPHLEAHVPDFARDHFPQDVKWTKAMPVLAWKLAMEEAQEEPPEVVPAVETRDKLSSQPSPSASKPSSLGSQTISSGSTTTSGSEAISSAADKEPDASSEEISTPASSARMAPDVIDLVNSPVVADRALHVLGGPLNPICIDCTPSASGVSGDCPISGDCTPRDTAASGRGLGVDQRGEMERTRPKVRQKGSGLRVCYQLGSAPVLMK